MAIQGTITIPEEVLNVTDAVGVTINKSGRNNAYFNGGTSLDADFSAAWATLSTADRDKVKEGAYIWIMAIAAASGLTTDLSGTF